MTPMNPFIERYQEKMNDFLVRLGTDPLANERTRMLRCSKTTRIACVRVCSHRVQWRQPHDNDNTAPWHDCLTQPAKELTIDTLDTKDLMLLHQLIFNYKSKLLDMLSEEIEKNEDKDWSQEEQLFEVLDMLGPPPSKAERKPRGALRMTVLSAVVLLCTHAIARAGACALSCSRTRGRIILAATRKVGICRQEEGQGQEAHLDRAHQQVPSLLREPSGIYLLMTGSRVR